MTLRCGRIDEHDEHETRIPGRLDWGHGNGLRQDPPLEFICPGPPTVEGGQK